MILECEECHSRYLVADTAIGAEGRVVRCASCRHSWFQAPAGFVAAPVSIAEPIRAPAMAGPIEHEPPFRAPAPIASVARDVPPPPPPSMKPLLPETMSDAAVIAPRRDSVADRSFRPRRNPARRATYAAVGAGVVMLTAVGAIAWSGAPGIAAQLGLRLGPAETPLKFAGQSVDRRDLPNGSELFAVSGRVVNATRDAQHVPDIRVVLRDAHQRPVYSWTLTPQQRSIGAGGALDFNSAKLDVPKNARDWQLSFAGEAGK